jgi:hypothetical protein
LVAAPGSRTIVARRAAGDAGSLVAILLTVLVVCAAVSGIVASLGPLQQQALTAALIEQPTDQRVVEVVATYDPAEPDPDADVRTTLAPVAGASGGLVVRRAETVELKEAGGGGSWSFTTVSGGSDVVAVVDGRLPDAASADVVEAAAPADSAASAPGDRLTLVDPLDGRRVRVMIVGTWEAAGGAGLAVGPLGSSLLVADDAFPDLAARAASVRWRVTIDRLRADRLAELQTAAAGVDGDVAVLDERLPVSVQAENPLVPVLADRARELVAQRVLLLMPAVLLLLLGAASAMLVASAVAETRRDEERLLRSRGAGRRQLVEPTLLEALLLCILAAVVGPLVAAVVVRIGDVRPVLDLTAWLAAAAAAVVCGFALVLPTAGRALGDDSGQLWLESRRRRMLTIGTAGVLLVGCLGAVAVLSLRGYADTVAGADQWAAAVDPLLVASPALLLLALATLLTALLLPVLLRVAAWAIQTRGVALALGTRFASRAPAKVIPLAVVVALVSGGVVFGAVERASQERARQTGAAYDVGADVLVSAPPASRRAGAPAERAALGSLPGVVDVMDVRRELDFVDEVGVEVLVADLAGAAGHDIVPDGVDEGRALEQLQMRPWLDPAVGVALPAGTRRIEVRATGTSAAGWSEARLLLADPEGGVQSEPAVVGPTGAVATLEEPLPEGQRLVNVQTDLVEAPSGTVEILVAQGPALSAGRWQEQGDSVVATFGTSAPVATGGVPVAVTAQLAEQAALRIGDTIEMTVLGAPASLHVVQIFPFLPTVADGRAGILVDAGTLLPALAPDGLASEPHEWWLAVDEQQVDAVAAALERRDDLAGRVLSRSEAERMLDVDPSTGGKALTDILAVTAAAALVIGGVLLCSVVVLRRRERAEQATLLRAVGAPERDVHLTLAAEYAVTAGVGAIAGAVAGAVVAAVTVAATAVGPGGLPVVPPPDVRLPWLEVLAAPAVLVAVPMLALLGLARYRGRSAATGGRRP